MTKTEKLKILSEWQRVNHDMDKVMAILDAAIGPNDGPLRHSVYTMQATYTRAIELIVGDIHHNCEWFALENDWGKKGMKAGPQGGMKPIRTLRNLLWLIEVSA